MSAETKILTGEQINELVADAHMHSVVCLDDFARAVEQAVLNSPEVVAMRRDAGRMLHCLEHGFPIAWEAMSHGETRKFWTTTPGSQTEYLSGIEAIDAAIAEAAQSTPA